MMARVYEAGGVWAAAGDKTGWVTLHEMSKGIEIYTGGQIVQLTPDAARRLARQLHRFAGRVVAK